MLLGPYESGRTGEMAGKRTKRLPLPVKLVLHLDDGRMIWQEFDSPITDPHPGDRLVMPNGAVREVTRVVACIVVHWEERCPGAIIIGHTDWADWRRECGRAEVVR